MDECIENSRELYSAQGSREIGGPMTAPAVARQPLSMRMLATSRRFFRWLTQTHIILSLIMLFLMFYMVIIPLYRMITATFTWQLHDLTRFPDAKIGGLATFHWVRMLTGTLGKIFMYTPLWNPRWSTCTRRASPRNPSMPWSRSDWWPLARPRQGPICGRSAAA